MDKDEPIRNRLAENVASWRARRRLSGREVSEKLDELGVPMLKTTLSKIENSARQVNVDELVALALALDVTPNYLLLTNRADDAEIALTPTRALTSAEAWDWATYRRPLDAAQVLRYLIANIELFNELSVALRALREAGVPLEVLEAYVGFFEDFEARRSNETERDYERRVRRAIGNRLDEEEGG